MNARILKPRPLTREAFAPFGDVIAAAGVAPRSINFGATERYHDLAGIDCTDEGGRTIVSLFHSTPREFPWTLRVVENHPLSSQAFVPLSGRPYLVVVAPKGPFDPDKVEAFLAGGNQGVNYAKGTWHHFVLSLGAASDFLVIDRDGPGNNCIEVSLDEFEPIILPPEARDHATSGL
jgi:ureidoglycolate lyase